MSAPVRSLPAPNNRTRGPDHQVRRSENLRKGNILTLTELLLIPMCGFVALGVDVGYMGLVRTQLQSAADAGALAGAGVIYTPPGSLENTFYRLPADTHGARHESQDFVRTNFAANHSLHVDLNTINAIDGDIVIGNLHVPWDRTESIDISPELPPNSVLVRVPMRAGHANGQMPLFFAAVFGFDATDAEAFAIATVEYPSLLPFATSLENWESYQTGGVGDNFSHTAGSSSPFGITQGGDGIPEIMLFPDSWNGQGLPPGNFGLVDIGHGGSTMTKIRRQVDSGPNEDDLAVHGGELNAPLDLSGKTGLKSSAKHAIVGGTADSRDWSGILGQVRVIPIYDNVTGNGNNSIFHIVRFVTVRVMALYIDGTLRIDHLDNSGSDITGFAIQPVTEGESVMGIYLSR